MRQVLHHAGRDLSRIQALPLLPQQIAQEQVVLVVLDAVADVLQTDRGQRAIGPGAHDAPVAVVDLEARRVPVGARAAGDHLGVVGPAVHRVVKEPAGVVLRGHHAHEQARLDRRPFHEPVGVRVFRADADVPPDVPALFPGFGDVGRVGVEMGGERHPDVHEMPVVTVHAEGGVVGRGHGLDVREDLLELLGGLEDDVKLAAGTLVEAVDEAQVAGAGGIDHGQVALDPLHALVEALPVGFGVEVGFPGSVEVGQVDGVEAFAHEVLQPRDIPLRRRPGGVDVVGVEMVFLEHPVVVLAGHVGDLILGVESAEMPAPAQCGAQVRVLRNGEVAHAAAHVDGLRLRACRAHLDLPGIDSRGGILGHAHRDPEGQHLVGGDLGDAVHEVQQRIGPPAVEGHRVRGLLRLDVAHESHARGDARALVVVQTCGGPGHVGKGLAHGDDDDLEALVFVPGARQFVLITESRRELALLDEDLLHGCFGGEDELVGAGFAGGL